MELQNHLCVLKVTGADALNFLQGQLSNDIHLADKHWQLSAYCNPKGRVLTLFSLWRTDDTVFLILDKGISEAIVKRLRMYVMRSKVTFEVCDTANCVAILSDLEETASGMGELQITDDYAQLGYGKSVLRVSFGDKPDLKSGTAWSQYLIDSGIPEVSTQTSELFVPQMINLDVLNAINFKKGCYTGQEIIARMHYLGKLKQRMYLLNISNAESSKVLLEDTLITGSKLISKDNKNLGSVVKRIDGQLSLLAVLRIEEVKEQASITLNTGVELQLANPQPYALPE